MRSARMFNDTAPARSRAIEIALFSTPTRRGFLVGSVAALSVSLFVCASPNYAETTTVTTSDTGAVVVAAAAATGQAAEDQSIRPFTYNAPQAKLEELRRRVAATQWPEKETVADESQGVPLGTMQELARYWATDHDWRKAEAKLNAFPQFVWMGICRVRLGRQV